MLGFLRNILEEDIQIRHLHDHGGKMGPIKLEMMFPKTSMLAPGPILKDSLAFLVIPLRINIQVTMY